MRKILTNHLLVFFGWIFIAIAIIGVILPILPTTPFLIVALAFFSKSSPRFHQMLLNNVWFGPVLRQWEETKTLSRQTKYKAFILIIITFLISALVIANKIELQLSLAALAIVLIFFIWRIKEKPFVNKGNKYNS